MNLLRFAAKNSLLSVLFLFLVFGTSLGYSQDQAEPTGPASNYYSDDYYSDKYYESEYPKKASEEDYLTEDEQNVARQGEIVPYARVCKLNYGLVMDMHMGVSQTFMDGEGSFNTSSGTAGDKLDLRDDLGLDRSSAAFAIGLDISLYAFRLSFDYTYSDFDGTRVLNRNITIDGQTYAVNTELDSMVRMNWYRVILGYSLFTTSNFAFGLDFAAEGVRLHYRFNGTSASSSTALHQSDTKTIPLVRIGIHMDFACSDSLVLSFMVNGFVAEAHDISAEALYAELSSRWYIVESVFLFLQGAYDYRHFETERDESISGDLTFHSWFASAGMGVNF